MANKRQQEKKKKAREKAVKAAIANRRMKMRKETTAKRKAEKVARTKLEPIINQQKKEAKIREQIAHNYEILKALNEEYEKEHKKKSELNAQLEAEGFTTMPEKLKALQEKFKEHDMSGKLFDKFPDID